ncbi:lipoate--protein ligase family protein [bacterium]|nr:MAG: lipoate--protein ligase family protein [bacterium]
MLTTWRLMRDDAATGAWNMAVDEAMLLAHAAGLVPPTLRFYDWNPFCLSLGRLQKQLPPAALEDSRDFDVVRRPTGGRSVWHSREITYSVVMREDLLPEDARSVEGAYRWLSEGFLRGLADLGLPVEMAPTGVRTNGANCFAASASCDFLADGKKLIGAAQCRKQGALLQHGSLLLDIDEGDWQHYAGGPMDGAISLAQLSPGLKREDVLAALGSGFARVAGGAWNEGGLSNEERQLAESLYSEKYSQEEWTLRARLAPEVAEKLETVPLELSL